MRTQLKKMNWTEYTIQFFLVLISIILAFNVENYRDNLQERKFESEYLQSIVEEIKEDVIRLETEVDICQYQIDDLSQILLEHPHVMTTGDARLNYFIINKPGTKVFSPLDITYTSMKLSGKLELIENRDVRKQVVMLYHRYYQFLRTQEIQYNERNKNVKNTSSEFYGLNKMDEKVTFNYPEAENFIKGELNHVSNKKSNYLFIIEACNNLINLITDELAS